MNPSSRWAGYASIRITRPVIPRGRCRSASRGAPLLFSGDTLFPGGPGATKFEGGDFPTIMRSIEDRMFRQFDVDTIVLPGHGLDTTIGAEAPNLDEWAARGW